MSVFECAGCQQTFAIGELFEHNGGLICERCLSGLSPAEVNDDDDDDFEFDAPIEFIANDAADDGEPAEDGD